MKSLGLGVVLILWLVLPAAASAGEGPPAGLYFGQEPPGDTPRIFAPGIISLEDRFEQFLIYTPDRSQVVFSVTNADWTAFDLMVIRREGDGWGKPEPAPFQGKGDALVAGFTRDMSKVFITTTRPKWPPGNVWMSRHGASGWSEPVKMGPPISSEADEWEVAVADNGTLYFSSARDGGYGDLDLYRAPLVDGGYPKAENLGPTVNTAAGDDLPWIAPDESWLIFASDREGTLGLRDLYITYRMDGAWSEPQSLGPAINSAGYDNYPFVSADGRYLFFTRRTEWKAKEDSDIWWVSAGFIDRLRKSALPAAAPVKE